MVTCATIGSEGATSLRGQHGLMDFFQVSESFQNQQIDSALYERCNLLAEGVARFLERSLAQGFDSGSQRANRSRDPNIEAFGGFTSEAGARPVDVVHFVGQAVAGQAKRIAAESIGFNNFGPGLQIFVMDSANQVGLR